MKYREASLALMLGALAAAPMANAGWNVVGSQGARHFVTVSAADAGEAVYRQAAAGVCRAGQACIVMFWTDAAQTPARMPMTTEQRAAVVAQYTRNPATGHEEILLKCSPGTAPRGRCLK